MGNIMNNSEQKKLTKTMTYTAIMIALYFVLSALFRIPVAGHISIDLGYIVLMVAAVCLGAVPAMLVGSLGALLESMVLAQRGISVGWVLMNAIIGYVCGLILSKSADKSRRVFIFTAIIVVIVSVFLGVVVKTLIDCAIYNLTIVVKIPTGIVAGLLDSFIMLAVGLPLSLQLRGKI